MVQQTFIKENVSGLENIHVVNDMEGVVVDHSRLIEAVENRIESLCYRILNGEVERLIVPIHGAIFYYFFLIQRLQELNYDLSKLEISFAVKSKDRFSADEIPADNPRLANHKRYLLSLSNVDTIDAKTCVIEDMFDMGATGDTLAFAMQEEVYGPVNQVIVDPLSVKEVPTSYREEHYQYRYSKPLIDEGTINFPFEWILGTVGMDGSIVNEILNNDEMEIKPGGYDLIELEILERTAAVAFAKKDPGKRLINNLHDYENYRKLLIENNFLGENIESIRRHPLYQLLFDLIFIKDPEAKLRYILNYHKRSVGVEG